MQPNQKRPTEYSALALDMRSAGVATQRWPFPVRGKGRVGLYPDLALFHSLRSCYQTNVSPLDFGKQGVTKNPSF